MADYNNQQQYGGNAASYYRPPGGQEAKPGYYPNQPPPQYGEQQQYDNQQAYGNGNAPNKQDFHQTFRPEGSRFKDIWAAILFLLVLAGFIAVSGLSIHGYSASSGQQGGGIYGDASTVGLNTNTIILLYVSGHHGFRLPCRGITLTRGAAPLSCVLLLSSRSSTFGLYASLPSSKLPDMLSTSLMEMRPNS